MRGAMKSVIFFFLLLAFVMPHEASGAVSFGKATLFEHRSKSVSPPAAAIDDEGRVYIAWLEEEKDVNSLYVAVSKDSGRTFLPEVRVNGPDDEPSGIHDAPAIALGQKGEVYMAWSAKAGAGFSSDLRFARSLDAGRSFEPSLKVNDNGKPASAGFTSIAAGNGNTVHVVWLDGRERASKGAGTFITTSKDGGRSFGGNIAIDFGSCPCCRTATAIGPDGAVFALWRKVFPGDIREMVMARSVDNGVKFSEPVIVGRDNWEISGCPHRASSVAFGKGGEVMAAWYAEVDGEPGIFLASSRDNGMSFEKERIETRRATFPDNVTLNARGEELLLAWQETTPVVSNVIFESRNGKERIRVKLNEDTRKAVSPVISVNGKGDVLVVWQKIDMRVMKTAIVVGK